MITLVLDCETIPLPIAQLEAMMPEAMKDPQMPPDIANPEEPNWEEKCPKYGGDEAKRGVWIADKRTAWKADTEDAKQAWKIGAHEPRLRFIERAALSATTGSVKMIAVREVNDGVTMTNDLVFLWESDKAIADRLTKAFQPKGVVVLAFMLEKQMLTAAHSYIDEVLGDGKRQYGAQPQGRVVTFYGNTFDFPFLARRAAILGSSVFYKMLRRFKKGRYLDGEVFIDLKDEWSLGDREVKSGGLESLAKTLGYAGAKLGDGASFGEWYAKDPEEGVTYCLGDIAATEHVARALGVI